MLQKKSGPFFTCPKKFSEAKLKSIGVIYLGKKILNQYHTHSAVLLLIMHIHVYNEKKQCGKKKYKM